MVYGQSLERLSLPNWKSIESSALGFEAGGIFNDCLMEEGCNKSEETLGFEPLELTRMSIQFFCPIDKFFRQFLNLKSTLGQNLNSSTLTLKFKFLPYFHLPFSILNTQTFKLNIFFYSHKYFLLRKGFVNIKNCVTQ